MKVLPRQPGDTCRYDTGFDREGDMPRCLKAATMRLEGIPYCARHAGKLMSAACGRKTRIERTKAQ